MQDFSQLKQQVRQNIGRLDEVPSETEGLIRAAVSIVIIPAPANNQAAILLTRRSRNLRRHAGQYALPGGRLDEGESITQAALRECEEEIGLTLHDNQVIGVLDDFVTRSGFCITPVVVCADAGLTPVPNPGEVEKIFFIPVDELAGAKVDTSESKNDESLRDGFSIMLPTIGHKIFAPTAAILYQFREVALLGRVTRVKELRQPRFAWR
jgi:8-oxo-dGTP pyrophosphatase MutT (NUDIX family)